MTKFFEAYQKKLDAKEREMKERESRRVEELVLLNESHERGLSYRVAGLLHGVSYHIVDS